MRLIDPKKLCEYANNQKNKQIDANDIMRFPTIEAEPVRKGSWVGIDDFPHEVWECDRCGNIIEGDRKNYCDNCGTKMITPTE